MGSWFPLYCNIFVRDMTAPRNHRYLVFSTGEKKLRYVLRKLSRFVHDVCKFSAEEGGDRVIFRRFEENYDSLFLC